MSYGCAIFYEPGSTGSGYVRNAICYYAHMCYILVKKHGLIDYLNVNTRGLQKGRLVRNRWGQYLVAVLLGVGALALFLGY